MGCSRGAPSVTAILSFDVGATHLRSAWVAQDGGLSGMRDTSTPRGDAQTLIDCLISESQAQIDAVGMPDSVGLAIAGFTDIPAGMLHHSPCMSVAQAELVPPLRDLFGAPVRLINDVNAAALGESRTAPCDHLIAIFVGTGIGTGFVDHGRLMEGAHGMAGEGGHLVYIPGGLTCSAGHVGCYSGYLGGEALARRAQEAGLNVDTAGLVAAGRSGDPRATAILDEACEAMAALSRHLITLFDPELIVIGGGVCEGWDGLFEATQKASERHPLAPDMGGVAVARSKLGQGAGLVGAGILAREALEGKDGEPS